MILVMVLSALCASTYTLGKAALKYTFPTFLIGTRLTIAGIIFLSYFFLTTRKKVSLDKHAWWIIFRVALCNFYVGFILEFWALQYMTSGKTALLYSLSPIVAACWSYLIFHERMTVKKVCGLLIALVAFIPVLMSSGDTQELHAFGFFSWPELAIIGAILAFTYGWVVVRKGLRDHQIPSTLLSGCGMIIGGCASLLTAYASEIIWASDTALWVNPWIPVTELLSFALYTGGLIIAGNIAYVALYAYLLKRYTTTVIAFSELITPIFAAFYGWAFLQENIPWYFSISLLFLLSGMYLYYAEERRQGYLT